TELINIGYGRAAAALSELTGKRIVLEVPRVAVHPIDEVGVALGAVLTGEVASVHQVFSGPVSGNALLLLDQEAARVLHSLLVDEETSQGALHAGAREALTEVGNILLNACLGVFGNLLQVQVTFSVPRLHIESVDGVLHSISVRDQELKFALMVHTRFRLRESDVSGYLVIILGMTSFTRLLEEIERWEQRQLTTAERPAQGA
ncbi:MAG TPA: chemotaxis protein CheC, partial [Bacillota bacterium]|nr:chemotaxis protein CheC [Bacillota bacterium]